MSVTMEAAAKIREKPITMKSHEVRAILDGRKTSVRRIVSPAPYIQDISGSFGAGFLCFQDQRKKENGLIYPNAKKEIIDQCPYGQLGDRLWVRETWAHYQTVNHILHSDGRSFSEVSDGLAGYKADGFDSIEEFKDHIRLMSGFDLEAIEINGDRWRPSIHMPHWASRITLEVTGVRVERLQNISEEDAIREGIRELLQQENEPGAWWCADPLGNSSLHCRTPRAAFARLWIHINGAGSWDANPWVWVIEFKRAIQ